MSERSRVWVRVRGSLRPGSEVEGEGGSEYGGEGGSGDMELWNEQKEWKESTLDERLVGSASAGMVSRWAVRVLGCVVVCRDRCAGAVRALPALKPFGLVGVFIVSDVVS